jgi:hypothetical protein
MYLVLCCSLQGSWGGQLSGSQISWGAGAYPAAPYLAAEMLMHPDGMTAADLQVQVCSSSNSFDHAAGAIAAAV